jgi:hypothetical protein
VIRRAAKLHLSASDGGGEHGYSGIRAAFHVIYDYLRRKTMKKTFLKLTVLALAGTLALAACGNAETGPAGVPGTPGEPGSQGPAGGAGVMVYDSSATPQLLGYLLKYPGRVLTPAGNIVDVTLAYTIIYFCGITTDPTTSDTPYLSNGTSQPATNTFYYNPWNGGNRFYYDGSPAVTDTTTWRLNTNGNSESFGGSSGERYPLKWFLSTFSELIGGGFNGTITWPLQYRTAGIE